MSPACRTSNGAIPPFGGVEELRRVAHGRVDADGQELAGPGDREDLGERPFLLLGLGALDLEHLVELAGDVVLAFNAHALEGTDGLDDAQVGGVPARGFGHRRGCAGADSGVVAEQEGTQRRDDGDGAQGALLARGRDLLDELAHLIRRLVVDRWSVRHLCLLLLLYWSYQGD